MTTNDFNFFLGQVVKCIKDRRRMRRYRLPSSSLKNIPTAKFKKGDPYDTCAICLEDYVDGDKLRILPCSHGNRLSEKPIVEKLWPNCHLLWFFFFLSFVAYHCKCIDPWLTRNRRVCPVCKRRVLVHGEHFSDSESETDETRPLLRPGSYGTQGGTFASNQRLHRQQRRERGRRTSAPAGADVEAGSRLSSASPSPSPSPSLRQAQHRPVLVEEAAVLHSAPTTVEAVVIESLPHNLVLSDIDEVDRSGLAISRRHNFFIDSRSEMANVFTVAINLVVVWFEINDRCLDLIAWRRKHTRIDPAGWHPLLSKYWYNLAEHVFYAGQAAWRKWH